MNNSFVDMNDVLTLEQLLQCWCQKMTYDEITILLLRLAGIYPIVGWSSLILGLSIWLVQLKRSKANKWEKEQ